MAGSDDAIPQLILARIEKGGYVARGDAEAIRRLRFDIEAVSAGTLLVRDGDPVDRCCVLVSGYACRHKATRAGGRQIVSFQVPGDLLDLQHMSFARADHNIEVITDAMIAWLPLDALEQLIMGHPAIGAALWREAMTEASIFREWVLNVGRRDGRSRIAHMLCEFVARCGAAGLGPQERLRLPMSQGHIADATGLTAVHVNRMLRALRAEGIIAGAGKDMRIVDLTRLRDVADFDPGYLHLAASGRRGAVRTAASAAFR